MRICRLCIVGAALIATAVMFLACIQGRISFSPDGKWFCFSAGILETGGAAESDRAGLFVVNVASAEVTRLLESESLFSTPVFLADGRTILYAEPSGAPRTGIVLRTVGRDGGGGGEVLLRVRLSDTLTTRELDGVSCWVRPSLSRDRKRLAFNVLPVSGPPTMLVLDLEERTVTVLPTAGLLPALTPSGDVVFLATGNDGEPLRRISEIGTRPLGGVLDLRELPDETFQPHNIPIVGVATHDFESGASRIVARQKAEVGFPCRALSGDGRSLSVGTKRGLTVYDLQTGKRRHFLRGEDVYHVQFDHGDDAVVALTGGQLRPQWQGAAVRVDLSTGRSRRLLGGAGMPNLVAIGHSPDGTTMVALLYVPTVRAALPLLYDRDAQSIRCALPDPVTLVEILEDWCDLLEQADDTAKSLFDRVLAQTEEQLETYAEDERPALESRLEEVRSRRQQQSYPSPPR